MECCTVLQTKGNEKQKGKKCDEQEKDKIQKFEQ